MRVWLRAALPRGAADFAVTVRRAESRSLRHRARAFWPAPWRWPVQFAAHPGAPLQGFECRYDKRKAAPSFQSGLGLARREVFLVRTDRREPASETDAPAHAFRRPAAWT